MKTFFYPFLLLFIFTACKTSKDYLLRSDEDKTLFDIVKKLNKSGNDEDATRALAEVYKQVQQRHLKKIDGYKNYKDIGKWDKLISEYNILQNMYLRNIWIY